MFERFTDSARAVLSEAVNLALELDSDHIGVGHILYGCAEGQEATAGQPLHDCGISPTSIRRHLRHTDGRPSDQVDPAALSAIGIDYEVVRAAVEETFGPGALEAAPDRRVPPTSTSKPFTPEAKRTLELSLRVAVELSPPRGRFVRREKNQILPGHLLLALLRLENAFVTSVVEEAGTSVAAVSAATLYQLAAAA